MYITCMDPYAVSYILREMALLIELSDPIPQKAFAYTKAAQAILSVKNLQQIVKKGELETISYIGSALAQMITSLILKEKLPYYEELKERVPVGLLELANIPGLSPRNLRILFEKLHITTLAQLKEAIDQGIAADLKIMAPSKLLKITKSIEHIQAEGYTLLFSKAYLLAQSFVAYLKAARAVQKIVLAGALRRKCPVISEIHFVGLSKRPEACLELFSHHPAVRDVQNCNDSQITVRLKNGLKAHLHISSQEQFTYAYFIETGSPAHVEAMVQYARKKRSEVSRSTSSEEVLYNQLGLNYIPPEMRENLGEIAQAEIGISTLIEEQDLRGAFHCHTTDSDGIHSLEEMVKAAQKLKWEYIGISDHSQSSHQAHGMDEPRLFAQIEKIQHLNQKTKIHIFAGIECDILKDGTLDFPNDVLKYLDFVIVSVHSLFKMGKEEMTSRIVKAIENPYMTILGHLTGRLLRHRDPYALDVDRVIDACIANKKVIELNSSPSRLDMDWHYWIQAKDKGLLCSINPDAHSTHELLNCSFGVQMARKGWLEKKHVINTLPLKAMISFLNQRPEV